MHNVGSRIRRRDKNFAAFVLNETSGLDGEQRDLRGRKCARGGRKVIPRGICVWIRLDTAMVMAATGGSAAQQRNIQPVTYFRARDRRIQGVREKVWERIGDGSDWTRS